MGGRGKTPREQEGTEGGQGAPSEDEAVCPPPLRRGWQLWQLQSSGLGCVGTRERPPLHPQDPELGAKLPASDLGP